MSYLLDSGNGGVAGEMPHGEKKDHDCVEYFSRLMPGASLIRLEAKETASVDLDLPGRYLGLSISEGREVVNLLSRPLSRVE